MIIFTNYELFCFNFRHLAKLLNVMRYLLPLLLLILSCKKQEISVIPAFYFWQSGFNLSEQEEESLEVLCVKKLYVKFFDVGWDAGSGQPVPLATLSFKEKIPDATQLIPVVFITNETFEKLGVKNDTAIKLLAFKIARKIEYLVETNNLTSPKEIQLDCDWTETTEQSYFFLIEAIKNFPAFKQMKWSATIRLHQIKYFEKTGVPPVDRGTLMFYNMGDIENVNTKNSIFEANIALQYIENINEYPLPLDVAIACFSWGLLFDEGKLLKIFYPLYKEDMADSLFINSEESIYITKKNFYFEGQFLVEGNTIKLETQTAESSLAAAKLLNEHLKSADRTVILYHLDQNIIKHYTNENFEAIYSSFK